LSPKETSQTNPWSPSIFLLSAETLPELAVFTLEDRNTPAGRRPDHAPSSAAGMGLFFATVRRTF